MSTQPNESGSQPFCVFTRAIFAAPEPFTLKGRVPGTGGDLSLCQSGNHSREQLRIRSKLRQSLLDLALHLLDIDVQFIAILRTLGLEVEDRREGVAADSLLVDRAST
jgi:hypothetical protein